MTSRPNIAASARGIRRGGLASPPALRRGSWGTYVIALGILLGTGGAAQETDQTAAPPAQLAGSVTTQPAPAKDDPGGVRIVLKKKAAGIQTISVPVNQGALVEFNVPVREVRVANPDIADVQAVAPKQILVNGKSFGTTQLLVTVDGGIQHTFTVAVDVDLERLRAAIRSLAPRARVEVTALLDSIVLSGNVPDTDSAERIVQIAKIHSPQVINQLRVAGVYQVLLRCTVAEVNRTATRQLGFNGWMAGENFQDVFAVSQLNSINPANIGAAADAVATARIPFLTDQNGLSLSQNTTLSLGFPNVQMQVFIQALRENGLLRVLAEPNLVTVSGQKASFLAGGEFPIPVPQGGISNAITITFREFGVRLNFTPAVLNENTIRIQVAPEVSEPDFSSAVTFGGFVIPGLTSRRVETVVELGPGQTFAIGGLLSERTRATSSKVPALGDVPVLGTLFSSTRYQSSETELVVLVTPELVAPLNSGQVVHVPGANHVPPNDWELFALQQLEGAGSDDPDKCKRNTPAGPRPRASYQESSALRLRGPVGPASSDELQ